MYVHALADYCSVEHYQPYLSQRYVMMAAESQTANPSSTIAGTDPETEIGPRKEGFDVSFGGIVLINWYSIPFILRSHMTAREGCEPATAYTCSPNEYVSARKENT